MQIFEEKKCILVADLLKKKSFSSRIVTTQHPYGHE